MPSFEIRKLKINEYINNAIPQLIEVFVEYYGEENREYITEIFNKTQIIGYGNPTNASYIINRIREKVTNKLVDDILGKITNDNDSKDELKRKLFGSHTFEFTSLMPLKKYSDFKAADKTSDRYESILDSVVNFLKDFYPQISKDNIEEMLASGMLSDMDNILALYEEAIKKYNDELSDIEEYIKESEKNKEDEKRLLDKYFIEFIKDFYDIIPTPEQLKFEEGISRGYINTYSMKTINAYLGSSLNANPLVLSFSEENEEILNTGSDWRVDSIKRERMRFFQALGFNLGPNYEDYMMNPECQKIIPSKELISRIENSKEQYKEKALIEFYNTTSEYLYNQERLKACNLLLGQDYNASAYHNKCTFVSPNLTSREEGLEVLPILCFNNNVTDEYMDKNLLHELNHVYELSYLGLNDGEYDFICGWDIVSQKEETKEENEDLKNRENKRKYELFNEIINEIIAQQLSKLMHEKGIYIINDETNAKDFGGTGYQSSMFLVVDFFNNFRNEILMSRKNGNIQIIIDKVGQENFDELNALFYEFNELFGGMKIYKVYEDMKKEVDSEELRKYNGLKEKRDIIVSHMIEYSNQMTL